MTPADIQRLAEHARAHHQQIQGITSTPWHTITETTRRAWLSTAELMVTEVTRIQQLERLADGERS
jgi:D-alanyl-D-alanine carboxypeptidase